MGLNITPRIGAPQLDTPGFFGGDSGITYEEIQARKKIARELMGGNGQIRNVGEGINSAAGSIAGAMMKRRADKEETKQRDAFNEAFSSVVPGLFGGGDSAPMTGTASTKTPDASGPVNVGPGQGGGYEPAPVSAGDWTRGKHEGVDPRLIEVLTAVREETGIPFVVTEGMRDPERQKQMVAQGKSQTMNSKHLHGGALDIAIMGPDGKPNWDFEAYRPLGDAFKRKAAELGYNDAVWGGDWKTLKDGVHFQMAGGGNQQAGGAMQPRMSTQGIRTAQAGGIDPAVIQQLAQLAGSPYASPGQKAIVGALLQQQLQAMQPADPMDELKRRQLELQIQSMENPGQGFAMMTPEELAQYGLEGPHQRGPDGRIYPLKREPLVSIGDSLTPGQEAADKEYGKSYVEWTQGGKADALNNIAKIEEVVGELEGGVKNLTGPGIGMLPKGFRDVAAPDSSFAQEQVEEVIQRNLRVILGAQFTEKEGQRLIERAYNPRLDEAQNARRLRQLLDAMRQAAEAKESQAQYFEKNGTIRGWTGKEWGMRDFEAAIDGGSEGGGKAATHRFNPETGKIEAIE